jgi:hypothetical protein
MSRDTQMEENTYEYYIECEFDYLVRLGLLDNIPFKYIKDYLPFEEIPVVDFEYACLGNGCAWEFDVAYKFTLSYNEGKEDKIFTGKIEGINTSSPNAIIFMELGEYTNFNADEEEDEEEE